MFVVNNHKTLDGFIKRNTLDRVATKFPFYYFYSDDDGAAEAREQICLKAVSLEDLTKPVDDHSHAL